MKSAGRLVTRSRAPLPSCPDMVPGTNNYRAFLGTGAPAFARTLLSRVACGGTDSATSHTSGLARGGDGAALSHTSGLARGGDGRHVRPHIGQALPPLLSSHAVTLVYPREGSPRAGTR